MSMTAGMPLIKETAVLFGPAHNLPMTDNHTQTENSFTDEPQRHISTMSEIIVLFLNMGQGL